MPGRIDRHLDGVARGRARARARPPLALRADPRRPRCRGPDRSRWRPPPDDEWRPPLARPSDPRPGRRSRGQPVPACRRSPRRRRLARLRDQQLGATWPRESPQPRVLGAPPGRGGGTRSPCLRRRDAALERGAPRPLPRGTQPRAGRRDGASSPARRRRPARPGRGRRRDRDPCPAHGSRTAARRCRGATAFGRLSMGRRRWSAHRRSSRPDRAHDPRSPPVERAVSAPHLSVLALTLGGPDC